MKKIYLLIRDDKTIEGYNTGPEEFTIEYNMEESDFDYFSNNYYYAKFLNNSIVYQEDLKVKEENKTQKYYRIQNLKLLLQESDYKITKCYEASLLNEEIPYNLQELLAQRKAWREEINAIEFEISMLG
jgi:hypothetical protein